MLEDRPLWVMIETAGSLFQIEAIASTTGVAAMVFGGNDLAKELGMRAEAARNAFTSILVQIVAAGRAFGTATLDGVFNDIDDVQGFIRQCRLAADLGFDGKTLIHPRQIEPCHDAFAPSEDDLAWARKVRDAFDLPGNRTRGAIQLEGRMVERLHREQALALLARATCRPIRGCQGKAGEIA